MNICTQAVSDRRKGARRCEKRAGPAGFRKRERNGSRLRRVATAVKSFKGRGDWDPIGSGGALRSPLFIQFGSYDNIDSITKINEGKIK